MRFRALGIGWLTAFALTACGTDDTDGLDPTDGGAVVPDAGVEVATDAGAPEDAGPIDTGELPTRCTPSFVEVSEISVGSSRFGPARAGFWGGDLVVAVPRLTTFTGGFGDVFEAATFGLYRPSGAAASLAFASGGHPLTALRSVSAFGDDLLITAQGPTTLAPEAVGGLVARMLPGERRTRYSAWTGASADGRLHATATATVGGLIALTSPGRRPELKLALFAPGDELTGSRIMTTDLDTPIEHLAIVSVGGRRVRAVSVEADALVVRTIDIGADTVEVTGESEGFGDVRHLEAAVVGDRLVAIVQRPEALNLLEVPLVGDGDPVEQYSLPIASSAQLTSAAREDRLAVVVHDPGANAPTIHFFDRDLQRVDGWLAPWDLPTQPALHPRPLGVELAAGDSEWGLVASYAQLGEGERAYHHVVRFGDCAL